MSSIILIMQRLALVCLLLFIVMAKVVGKVSVNIESFDLVIRTLQPVPFFRHQSLADLRIVHITRNSRRTYKIYNNINKILKNQHFDMNKPTAFYIHGYVELITDESVKTIERAYLKNGGYNLLILDWSNLSYGNYFYAATNVGLVSRTVGRVLSTLCRSGLRIEGLHLVGHSLGAHIAGGIARVMRAEGLRISRITGLDPAGPLFHPSTFNLRPISSEDGDFVDVIHTDGTKYGTLVPSGDVDFYPNGGFRDQPGCPRHTIVFTVEDFCSHHRSWRLFAESVTGGGGHFVGGGGHFVAVKCDSYEEFLSHRCGDGNITLMGEHLNVKLRGHFYLRTNNRPPYALGIDGVK